MTAIALGSVVDIVMGQAPPGNACNKDGVGVPFVKAGEFQDRRPVIREWTTKPLKMAQHDDTLVCVVGATAGKVNQGAACAIGRSVAAVRPQPSAIDPEYLYRFLSTTVTRLRGGSQGAAQGVITREMIGNLELDLPPLPEQRRLAAILDQADALRAKRRQVLTHLDSLNPAVFNKVLAGAAFPSKSLAEVADIWDCPHSTPKWTTSGSICLRTPNLTRGGWNWEDTRYVDETQFRTRSKGGGAQAGDIVLSREGTVGIAAIVQPGMEVCMGQRLVQVRPDPDALHPQWALEYLLTALHPDRISAIMVGSTAQHLNVKDLRALPIPVPQMSVQREFAERAAAITSALESVERARAADDGLFASLQSRAFRGEL